MSIEEQLRSLRHANRKRFTERIKVLKPDEKPQLKSWVCCFDLETTNLYGNFMGVVLCAVIKPWGGKPIIFRGDQYDTWENGRSDDSQIVLDIYDELKDYGIWVAHNGLNFDINFLRTRMAELGIDMPQPKNVDPVRLARRYLRFKFNNLEAVGEHYGFFGKTRVNPKKWNKAALDGHIPSLEYIVEHCVADVELLEKITSKMSYLIPKVTNFGSDT